MDVIYGQGTIAAEKAKLYDEYEILDKILNATSVYDCIIYYKTIIPKHMIYTNLWEKLLKILLLYGTYMKFSSSPFLISQLLSTRDSIIKINTSNNWNHTIKKVGTEIRYDINNRPKYIVETKWINISLTQGNNWSGECLMIVRSLFRQKFMNCPHKLLHICTCNNMRIDLLALNELPYYKFRSNCIIWQRIINKHNTEDDTLIRNYLPVRINCMDTLSATQHNILQNS